MSSAPGDDQVFDVAFVCTGNRYRSVIAEATFRAATNGLPVRVGSYGTLDLGPAPPLESAFSAARELGLDISRHYSRCLVDADLRGASLVVGFEADHVLLAVAEAGAPRERTFTVLELLDLLDGIRVPFDGDPLARAAETVRLAHEARGNNPGPAPAGEIVDPIGKPRALQRSIGHEVHAAVSELAERLFDRRIV